MLSKLDQINFKGLKLENISLSFIIYKYYFCRFKQPVL